MKKYLLLLIIAITLCGCQKDDFRFESNDVTISENGMSISRLTLSYEQGDQLLVTFAMMEDWYIETLYIDQDNAGFAISKDRGMANVYEDITVESLIDNPTINVKKLGTLVVKSTRTDNILYTIDVDQNCKRIQTTLAYFGGTSLGRYYDINIADVKSAIKSGALGGSGRYIYLLPSSDGSAVLKEITLEYGECKEYLIKEYIGFASLAESSSITTVIDEVKEYIDFEKDVDGEPQRMNLIVSSHGTGWVPYVEAKSFASAEPMDIMGGGYWEPQDPNIVTRYLGVNQDGWISIDDFKTALYNSGVNFGYVIFDACYMSSVEALYRLRDCCDYIVASPSEIMGAGFPYKSILKNLYTNDGRDFDLRTVCEGYYNYYQNEADYRYGSIAMCVTSELEPLAAAMSRVQRGDFVRSDIQSYDKHLQRVYFDLGDYVNSAGVTDVEAFNTQFDKAFPPACRLHTDWLFANLGGSGSYEVTDYSGVTTSEPSERYSIDWGDEEWAKASAYRDIRE